MISHCECEMIRTFCQRIWCCCCPSSFNIQLDPSRDSLQLLAKQPNSDSHASCSSEPLCNKRAAVRRYSSIEITSMTDSPSRRLRAKMPPPRAHTPLGPRRSESSIRSEVPRNSMSSASGNKTAELKLAVLGAPKVGKTALVGQFLWGGFIQEYRPTVEEFNWVEYDLGDGADFLLKVIDTSGSHDFLAMRHLYTKTSDAFLVVFSVDDLASFEEARQILDEIKRTNVKEAPVLLLANKTDLYGSDCDWPVAEAEIGRCVSDCRCSYTALTATNSEMVQQVFRQVMQQTRGVDPSPGPNATLKKRRQSMPVPSNRHRGTGGLDPKDFARIAEVAKRAERENKGRGSCAIS